MSTTASGLKNLHHLHIKLRQVHEKIERGPKQIKARQQYAQRKQDELETEEAKLLDLKKAADHKSLQLKTNESKIAELRTKLNTANSNREFDVFKSQIDADTMANSVLEDEILEVLEKVDEMQGVIGKLREEVEAAQQQEKRVADEIASAEPRLREEAQELEDSIRSAESMLPEKVAEIYRRLVQAHGANALAPVENGACTSCYVGLSPQSRVELNSGKIIFCKNCGRLLYSPESD